MKESLAPGDRVAHYRVESILGAGGMGEVYLARDTRLDRAVALKILPSDFARDGERMRRFVQEAKAASALNHPNVAHIYEIGEAAGVHFIAMEHVEGKPLSARIASRSVTYSEAVDIAAQAVDALDEAHSKGVTHRDIKPGNLMITPRGQVKVLDFGLAKVARPAESGPEAATAAVTEVGMVMGTVQYMSPEQALGRDVDHRTDIFSFGIVMYEMFTGHLPFAGRNATESLDRVLHAQPEPLSKLQKEAPAELERIVRKCLEKERERRYASARDLLVDLRNLKRDSSAASLPQAVVPARKNRLPYAIALAIALAALGAYLLLPRARSIDTIAVLPFLNAGGNADTEYLSDGITDNLINTLAQAPNLKVTARGLVFRYKGQQTDPIEIGKKLKVSAVLTGRVVPRGDTFNIQVDLMDVADGTQIWGRQYTRPMADVMAVQEDISREVSARLRHVMGAGADAKLAAQRTAKPAVVQAYMKGRYHALKYKAEDAARAIEYFSQAISMDPAYAPAYAGLAEAYILAGYWRSPGDDYRRARSAAVRALELDDSLAEAHTALGVVKYTADWDWDGAEQSFRKALELNPNYAWGHDCYGFFLAMRGQAAESIRELERAAELDPLSVIINSDLADATRYARHPAARAIELFRKALELDNNFWLAHMLLGCAYRDAGNIPAAIAEMETAGRLTRDPAVVSNLGHLYAISGQAAKAREVLRRLGERKDFVPPFEFARVYIGLGEKDRAFDSLEKAYADRHFAMTFIKVDPVLDPLRSDPRFADLLRRVGLAP